MQYWDEAARVYKLEKSKDGKGNSKDSKESEEQPKEPDGPEKSKDSKDAKGSANETELPGNFSVQQLRWILNFTFPMKFANWTPQFAVSAVELNDSTIKDWCSRGAFWGGMLEPDGRTRWKAGTSIDNDTKREEDEKKAKNGEAEGDRRRLHEL